MPQTPGIIISAALYGALLQLLYHVSAENGKRKNQNSKIIVMKQQNCHIPLFKDAMSL